MAGVFYSEAADAALNALEADAALAGLRSAVENVLATIEAAPSDRSVRQRGYTVDGMHLFGVPVRTRDHDWLVLWEPAGDDTVTIHYVGADL